MAPILAAAGALSACAASCESLSTLTLPETTITTAESVPAGTFAPPYGNAVRELPAFCRVTGVIAPTSDSNIRFEIWLPVSGWNSKFLGVGNGGFAGSISYEALGGDLRRGYATAATDTGHEGEAADASWAYKHPENVTDFGYRALHKTAANAKAVIQAFYGQPAQRSYFDSCSNGGREALMEAQRFPEDYDGILAGAPANFWTHMLASGIDVTKAVYGNPAAYISNMKTPAITAAALAACDAQDGVKDGVISNPQQCHFDPSMLLCKEKDSHTCLTAPQIGALKKLYSGGQDSHGKQIFPGFMPGVEHPDWAQWVIGFGPGGSAGAVYMENYFRYMVFDDPAWNPLTANADTAMRTADEKTARVLNATEPDLSRFYNRGGKLILYHGWNDQAISPLNTVNYYESVLRTMGKQKADGFIRLYMVPGMEHCLAGPGANSFGQLGRPTAKGAQQGIYTALEQWVESGAPPADIVATKYAGDNSSKGVQMTRPVCAYPQIAKYKGSGDSNDSVNFACGPVN
jgi:hypothetical protein